MFNTILFNVNEFLEKFLALAEGKEVLILLITIFLCFLEAVVPMLPLIVIVNTSIVILKSLLGSTLGIVAALSACVVGSFLGHIGIFILIKSSFSKKFIEKIKKTPKILKITEWISNRSDTFMILLLANPYTPSSVVNYSMGLVGFETKRYVKVVFIGKIFLISFMGLFGIIFKVGDKFINFLWIFFAYGVIYLIVLLIKKTFERKKNYEKNDN